MCVPAPSTARARSPRKRIPPRLKIGEIRGESISVAEARIRATRSERIMIVELSARKRHRLQPVRRPMRYTNHSCRPNARLCIRQGRVEFYALRAIAAGEEITVDYGETHHEGRLRLPLRRAGLPRRAVAVLDALPLRAMGSRRMGR